MSQTAAKKAKLDNDKPNYELAEMLSGMTTRLNIWVIINHINK